MPEHRTIVLVGHCGPDMHMLKAAVGRILPGATITVANDESSLAPHLHANGLLLVNRVMDGSFEFEAGVELIEKLAANAPSHRPVMILISNYEDAQQAATKAGAKPGFGKSALYAETTAELLREAARIG